MSINGSSNFADLDVITENDGCQEDNIYANVTKLKPMPLSISSTNFDRQSSLVNNVTCVINQTTQLPVNEASAGGRRQNDCIFRFDGISNASGSRDLLSSPSEGIASFLPRGPSWGNNLRNGNDGCENSTGLLEDTSSQSSSCAGSSNGRLPYTAVRNTESLPLANSGMFGGRALVMSPGGDTFSAPMPTPTTLIAQSREEKLLELINRTGYQVVQRNGQMIYGGPPPGWPIHKPAPCKGSEVFVGKVPRDIYEDELVPIFERVGRIYELRLMMDFSGSNRGYFFVRYTCKEDAKRAVRELNNYEVRPNKPLGVIHSVDNRKLWISGIPQHKSPAEIKADMERLTEGVRDVILYSSQNDKSKTRGYAFVEYESHRAAALARRKLVPGRIFVCGQEIEKVDWAEPENEVDEETMSKVRVLFLRNLMGTTTELQIRQFFNYLSGGQVERVKKAKDYAFVHFASREAAERAKMQAVNLVLDGAQVEVTWSKPVNKQIYNQRRQPVCQGFSAINMTMPDACLENSSIRRNAEPTFGVSANQVFQGPPPSMAVGNYINHFSNHLGTTLSSNPARKLVGNNGMNIGMYSDQLSIPQHSSQALYTDQFIQTLHDLKLLGPSMAPAAPMYQFQPQHNAINGSLTFYGEAIRQQILNSGSAGSHQFQEMPFSVPPNNGYFSSAYPAMEDTTMEKLSSNISQPNEYCNVNSTNVIPGISNSYGHISSTVNNLLPSLTTIPTTMQSEH